MELEIAEKYNLPVLDFYSIVEEHKDLLIPDGVHLQPDGYFLLAEAAVKKVRELLD